MLLLRIANRSRWAADRVADDPGHAADAAADLRLKPYESGLSVFRVEGEDDSREAAVRFALTCRKDRRPADYLVFSSALAEALGLAVAHVPREDLDPFLGGATLRSSDSHPELTVRLAAAILADANRHVGRVPKDHLEPLGAEICRRDPELQKYLKGDWATRLAPLLDDSTS